MSQVINDGGVTATLRNVRQAVPDAALKVAAAIDVEAVASGAAAEEYTGRGVDVAGEFGLTPVPAATVTPIGVNQAVTPTATQQVGVYHDASDGAIEGDFGTEDVRYPTLRIVQGSGPLSQQHSIGCLLLGDEELLPPPDMKPGAKNTPLQFVPLQLTKQYRENLSQEEYANKIMPRTVGTLEEVESLGGSTEWRNDANGARVKPSWSPSARCVLLLKKPEGCAHPAFTFALDGAEWAPAVYFCTGGAYGRFVKTILSNQAAMYVGVPPNRKILLSKYVWNWQTVRVKAGDYAILVPDIKLQLKNLTGPEAIEFGKELISGPKAHVEE